jgi:hypothetical protein
MLSNAFDRLEAPDVSAAANLASRYDQFLAVICSLTETRELLSRLSDPQCAVDTLVRVYDLTSRKVDEAYENPWDVALATYVWVLAQKWPTLGWLAAKRVMRCPNCWWAHRVAETVRKPEPANTSATNAVGAQAEVPTHKGLAPRTFDLQMMCIVHPKHGSHSGDFAHFGLRSIEKAGGLDWQLAASTLPFTSRQLRNLGSLGTKVIGGETPESTSTFLNLGATDWAAPCYCEVPA